MSPNDLTDYDVTVLKYINNPGDPSVEGQVIYGAALMVTVEFLKGRGFLKLEPTPRGGAYVLTDKGRDFLKCNKDVAS